MSINSRNKGAKEIWKDIPGYEGVYQASSFGRIKSIKRTTTKGGILKQYVSSHNGYCYVSLHRDGKGTSKRVHKLIMMTFDPRECKPGYDKDNTINHIDGDKTNNRLSNLEWCTQSENQIKAYETGINGKACKRVINLDTMQVFESMTEAAKSVGGRKVNSITRVCKGVRSQYRDNHFAYYDDFINGTVPMFRGKAKGSAKNLWR